MWVALILIGIVGFLLYKILKPSEDFWKPYGVRHIPVGSFMETIDIFLGKKTLADLDDTAYEKLGTEKFCGFVQMQQPVLLVKDLEIIKKVMIKDFDHFLDRRNFASSANQRRVTDKMIANLSGEEWKGMRVSLSPTFTTGKIRRMMDTFDNISNEWVAHLTERVQMNPLNYADVNIDKEITHYTVDVIGATVFGMDAGTIRNPDSHFSKMVHKLSDLSLIGLIKFGLCVNFPNFVNMLGISVLDEEAMTFFENILSQGLKDRLQGKVKLDDFMQLVVEARKGEVKAVGSDELGTFEKDAEVTTNEKKNYLMDDDYANAQAIGFLFAGFSTISNFIGFFLYNLAVYQDVQTKLRGEITSKLFKGGNKKIDYDELNSLVYLDMVVCEVLRKYPGVGRLERKCTKDYEDPTENLKVPKGAMVGIPVQSIHNDKRYYEYPDKFYPEHFTPEKKAERSPYTFLPFGSGPRNCIGMRFALVESKAAIAHIVHNFIIEPSPKTPVPIKVKAVGIGVQIPDHLELRLKPVN